MGQVLHKLESILSNEFLSDKEILETLDFNGQLLQNEEVEKIKKDLHEFCVLILETFRNEKKNKP